MAAVLSRSTTDFGLFHAVVRTPPIVTEPAYNVSLYERGPPASFAMYGHHHHHHHTPHRFGPEPNRTSQPFSSPLSNSRHSATPPYTSSPTHLDSAARLDQTSSPLVSARGMIVVLSYTPSEGEANIPVTVNLELHPSAADPSGTFGHSMSLTSMKLRLVFGRTAVKTIVKRVSSTLYGEVEGEAGQRNVMRLRLHASAPPHSEVRFPEQFSVPLTIQAMDDATEVVESFTFGSFTYWAPTTIRPAAMSDLHMLPSSPNKRKREEDVASAYSSKPEFPPTLNSPKKVFGTPPRVGHGHKLVRTTNAPAAALNGAETQPAELEWVVEKETQHPSLLDKKWSANELSVGRRLIRFRREMSGNKLRVSCDVIKQDAYNEDDIVISCVYRQETGNCWFTSVDVIYLLERLVGGPFSVEEKNRIRRNLEGFKPTTVSKTKGGFEMFFQRIMDFPPPKPRNIEKDVKVFAWSLLVPALDKIISKYSVIPISDSDSQPSSQESPSLSSSGPPSRATKAAARSRSSSNSQRLSEESDFAQPLKSGSSHQPLHMVIESPHPLHTESTVHVPEHSSMQMPTDHYYFPDVTFPEEDQWPRRDSIVSHGTTPTQINGYFSNHGAHDPHATPGPVHSHAFSNPFASDVNFGSMSLVNHGSGNVLDASADLHGGADSNIAAHAMMFDSDIADDVFASRRSSLGSELLYPVSDSPSSGGSHNAVVTAFNTGTQDPHNVPHDLLYSQYHTGSHNHLPLDNR